MRCDYEVRANAKEFSACNLSRKPRATGGATDARDRENAATPARECNAPRIVGAICMDRTREIIFGWEIEERELLAQVEGRHRVF